MRCLDPRRGGMRVSLGWLVLMIGLAQAGLMSPAAGQAAQDGLLLEADGHWRYHMATRNDVLYQDDEGQLFVYRRSLERVDQVSQTIGLPEGGLAWTQPDFDDAGWTWHRGPLLPGERHATGHGQGGPADASHLLVRGRFDVVDPSQARDLQLSVSYRGGIVVYLNGQEIARQNLPEGEITEATLATAYRDSDIGPNPESEENAAQAARLRLRKLDNLSIASSHLRPGVNVLAFKLVAAPQPTEAAQKHSYRNRWATVGLQTVALVGSPTSAFRIQPREPQGVQVWTAPTIDDIAQDVRQPDPAELAHGIRPIRLVAGRNMTISGQAVVSSAQPVTGVSAQLSAFTGDRGALRLPAQAVQIRYPARTIDGMPYEMDRPDVLVDKPTGKESLQPIWVTVHVPADAQPGAYRATLSVQARGLSQPVEVPVELVIHAWDCPDPQAWRSMVSMVHSPHSVAWHYGEVMWSERHLELLKPSLGMMRALGNNVMYIDVIHPTFFGNEHGIIVFKRQGGRLVPDFTYLDRFLNVYASEVGEPRAIVLGIWEPYAMGDGVSVSVRKAGGGLEHVHVGRHHDNQHREMWKAMMEGVHERVKQRGWDERAIQLGVGHDRRPSDETVSVFNDISPYARWMIFTHGRGDPSIRDGQVRFGNMPVGLQEYPYYARGRAGNAGNGIFGGWVNDWYDAMIIWAGRMMLNDNSPPAHFRLFPLTHVMGRSKGFCRQGMDKWPVVNPDRESAGRRRMVHGTGGWGNLYRHKVRALVAPGPDGAMPTTRFELLREGLQDTEARIFLERALVNEQARAVVGDEINDEVRSLNRIDWEAYGSMPGNTITPGTDWQKRYERRLELAAEVQRRLAAAGLME